MLHLRYTSKISVTAERKLFIFVCIIYLHSEVKKVKLIRVRDETWERLMVLKIKGGFKSIDAVIQHLLGVNNGEKEEALQ